MDCIEMKALEKLIVELEKTIKPPFGLLTKLLQIHFRQNRETRENSQNAIKAKYIAAIKIIGAMEILNT